MYMYLFSVFNTFNNFKQVLVSLVLVNFDSVKQTNCNNGLEVLACKLKSTINTESQVIKCTL